MEHDPYSLGSDHNERGIGFARAGQYEEARQQFEAALRYRPDFSGAYNNLGNVLKRMGRFPEAEQAFLRAILFDPLDGHPLTNIAKMYWQSGRLVEAVAVFRNALRHQPKLSEGHRGLCTVLAELGRLGEAEACALAWIEQMPESGEAHMELGKIRHEMRQLAATESAYRRALELDPSLAAAHANLGFLLSDQGRVAEAFEHYDSAYRITPQARIRIVRDTMLPPILESIEHLNAVRSRLVDNLRGLNDDGIRINTAQQVMPALFYLAYHGMNDRSIYEAMSRLGVPPRELSERPPRGNPGGKIRVGILSKCLRDHTIGRLNRDWIVQLPRSDFEVVLLPIGDTNDQVGRAMRARADRYFVVPQNLAAALQSIAQLQLDVMFYPDIGMDPFGYTLAFTRLAPVQCVTWGHPDTTGLPTIDYFISCVDGETPTSEASYSERLVKFPRLGVCYERLEPADRSAAREQFGFGPGDHIYCCPQTLFKFHPDFDAVLANILRADPRGQLHLLDSRHGQWRELLLARWQRTMPDVIDRLRFHGSLPRPDFLKLLAASDVLLDPLHFGGGNSSYEGLAMGTPIVTLPSEFLRGRLTYAMYRQIGMKDLIVTTPGQYAELAVRIATEPDLRQVLSRRLLNEGSVLFEDRRVVNDFVQFFHQAVGR